MTHEESIQWLENRWKSEDFLTDLNIGFSVMTGEEYKDYFDDDLTKLYLYNNNLTTIPESIGNLTNLKRLNLYNNNLTSLPESIGNLSSLERLYLSNNKLTNLPESIGNLSNLQYLYLHNNNLPQSELDKVRRLLPNTEIYGLYIQKSMDN